MLAMSICVGCNTVLQHGVSEWNKSKTRVSTSHLVSWQPLGDSLTGALTMIHLWPFGFSDKNEWMLLSTQTWCKENAMSYTDMMKRNSVCLIYETLFGYVRFLIWGQTRRVRRMKLVKIILWNIPSASLMDQCHWIELTAQYKNTLGPPLIHFEKCTAEMIILIFSTKAIK